MLDKGEVNRLIFDVPFLLIDDEADLASINTKAVAGQDDPDDYERAATNREIVRLLRAFDKSAYVGYTATPFANIFINPEDEADVFPRSFIIKLEQPDNYVGAVKLFGLPADPEADVEEQEPLPLVVEVTDEIESFPEKYKQDHDPVVLPPSLKEAIDAFVLVCAAAGAWPNQSSQLNVGSCNALCGGAEQSQKLGRDRTARDQRRRASR